MSKDTVYRQDAIDALGERPMVWTDDDQYTLGERNQYDRDRLAIETLPSAEKVGEWIEVENKWGGLEIRCSECGAQVPRDGWGNAMQCNYCPNCGARMKGEGDDQ